MYQHSHSYESYLEFNLQRQRFSKNYINHWALLFSSQTLMPPDLLFTLDLKSGVLAGQACSTPRPIQCQTAGSTDEGNIKLDIEGDYITQSVAIHNGTVSKWCGRLFY
jgi:hypothetical protein